MNDLRNELAFVADQLDGAHHMLRECNKPEHVQRCLHWHVINLMCKSGPRECGWVFKHFVNEYYSRDIIRGVLRQLTEMGMCGYHRFINYDDFMTHGSGYVPTGAAFDYYDELKPYFETTETTDGKN